jgi:hypothetical protein
MAAKKKTKNDPQQPRISFDFIKSRYHRVIMMSGVHGGPTPDGKHISMSLFNERQPIPKRETFELNAGGRIGQRVERLQRAALVREVEITVQLDSTTAEVLIQWLRGALKTLESVNNANLSEKSANGNSGK